MVKIWGGGSVLTEAADKKESGLELRNRSALAVNCCVIIHCLEFSCKEDQITSAQQFKIKLAHAKFLNALFSWGTAE